MKTKGEIIKIIKFGLVGILNTLVDMLSFQFLCTVLMVNEYVSATISFTLAMIHSYLWNKFWTFGAGGQRSSIHSVLEFCMVNLAALGSTYICLFVFLDILNLPVIVDRFLMSINIHISFEQNYGALLCKLMAFPFVMTINYCGNRFIVFKEIKEKK